MAKILINLLPSEIIVRELKKAKFYKIQLTGIVVILTMIFLASLTVALRILQSHNITEVQAQLTQTEQKVSDLKSTQASLFLLKDRLAVIDEYLGVSSKQSAVYKLLDKLIPSTIVINAITVNKADGVVLLALAPDSVSLDNLMNNLTTKEKNEGNISQVSVESLNRGKDGFYRISFKIKPK
ncbi:MAG: hypothetical protein Q7R82_01215 [Candidatus Daviesbacteria bacterium]|nr:hypothetical protein [Candidatus Daviesbacteria bacterium]